MKRPLLAFAAAVLIAAALVPTARAADEGATDAPGPTPAAEPTPFDGNGEIVIDPTFITGDPDPTTAPDGSVQGATGRPGVTPPPTDATSATTTPGTSLQVLLVLAVAGSLLVLFVGRGPAERRR